MTRNVPWERDELILALELYVRIGHRQLDQSHPDVIALSDTLRQMNIPECAHLSSTFRNPAGVAMKLGNFGAIDPGRSGRGLSRGGKTERDVWDEFVHRPTYLKTLAENIRAAADHLLRQSKGQPKEMEEGDEAFNEGRLLTRLHIARERNKQVVKRKKRHVLDTRGCLACEACGFDFANSYPKLGAGFAECHHRTPLAELKPDTPTRLSDLAIVCANCHRMLHRATPQLSIEALKEVIKARPTDLFRGRG